MNSMNEQIHIASWPGNKWGTPNFLSGGNQSSLAFSRVYAMQTQTYTLVASGLIGPAAVEFFSSNDEEKKAILGSGGGIAQIIDPEGNYLCEPLPEDQEGILYADVDLNNILGVKTLLDPVGHYSRPDIFSLNIDKDPNPMTKVVNESGDNAQVDEVNTDFEAETEDMGKIFGPTAVRK